ncbi:hypothetical protein JW758_02665 [Candidatus Peregrinibacteria bacterium]|nr:hypothetical protein [Candidatus Peregrinibacteria bacterium]
MKKVYSAIIALSFIFTMPIALASDDVVSETDNAPIVEIKFTEPEALPGQFSYYWINFKRTIKSIITLNPVKQSKLDFELANKMIMEIHALTLKGDQEHIATHIKKYNKLIDKMHKRNEKSANLYSSLAEVYEMKLEIVTKYYAPVISDAEEILTPELLEVAHNTNPTIFKSIKQATINSVKNINHKSQEISQSVVKFIGNKTIGKFDNKFEVYDEYMDTGETVAEPLKKTTGESAGKETEVKNKVSQTKDEIKADKKENVQVRTLDSSGEKARLETKVEVKETKTIKKEASKEVKSETKEEIKEEKAEVKEAIKEDKAEAKEELKEAKTEEKEAVKEVKSEIKEDIKEENVEVKEAVKEDKTEDKEELKEAKTEEKEAAKDAKDEEKKDKKTK